MSYLWWILSNLDVVLAVALAGVAFWLLGWRGVLTIVAVALPVLGYRRGSRDAEERRYEEERRVIEERRDAYEDINSAGNDRDSVSDDLRDGRY